MNLGELLSALVGGAGAGFQHQNAVATRGGDYLQKEELLARSGRAAAIDQGNSLREAALKQAAIKAAALQAREGQTSIVDSEVGAPTHTTTTQDLAGVPEGASDELAAAVGDRRTKTRMDEANLEKTGSAAELAAMRALAANPEFLRQMAAGKQGSAETIAKGHDTASTTNAVTAAGAKADTADKKLEGDKYKVDHRPPPQPKMQWLKGADGKIIWADPATTPGAQPKPGATDTNQAHAARITENLGKKVSTAIDEAGDEIGAVTGKREFILNELGEGQPAVRKLVGMITGLAGSHLRLVGNRGRSIQQEIQHLLTTTQSVESLKGALEGILTLSQTVDEELNGPASETAAAAAAVSPDIEALLKKHKF